MASPPVQGLREAITEVFAGECESPEATLDNR